MSPEKTKQPLCSLLVRLSVGLSLLAAIPTLAPLAARWRWQLDLMSHFAVQVAVGAALPFLILLLARRWKLAIIPAAIGAVNACYVLPAFIPATERATSGPEYRVVSANIRASNRDSGLFMKFLGNESPDVVLVLEVDDYWSDVLGRLHEDFPYSVIQSRKDSFGIALLSRLPIASQRVEYLDEANLPTIVATIQLNGQVLHFVGTHPLPPVGKGNADLRNQHLRALAGLVVRLPRPVIVVGDLNITSGSPFFHDLVERSRLRDSRNGFGVQPTWPNGLWLFRIPIDHALISDDLIVTQRYVGPDIGSDHRPIVVGFKTAAKD